MPPCDRDSLGLLIMCCICKKTSDWHSLGFYICYILFFVLSFPETILRLTYRQSNFSLSYFYYTPYFLICQENFYKNVLHLYGKSKLTNSPTSPIFSIIFSVLLFAILKFHFSTFFLHFCETYVAIVNNPFLKEISVIFTEI